MLDLGPQDLAALVADEALDTILLHGESLETLKALSDNSVHSLVTDPPAGIGIMGTEWDTYDLRHIRRMEEREARRALPGGDGHFRASNYAGGYDYSPGAGQVFVDRMCAIFTECRRVMKPGAHGLVWALPKTSHWTATALEEAGFEIRDVIVHIFGQGFPKSRNLGDGRGTALKPAAEHWILVRKPLGERTIAQNVLRWGTGGLNIDGCRIPCVAGDKPSFPEGFYSTDSPVGFIRQGLRTGDGHPTGRFPTNLIFSHHPECEEDQCLPGCPVGMLEAQHPGASRFFYCAKPSRKEKHAAGHNIHPTVKPIGLMRYLGRLITPSRGIVLDCFMGSGTTGVAAIQEGFRFVGIEREGEYLEVAHARIQHAMLERK